MNLIHNDYPEQYRIRYNVALHAFEILVPLKTIADLQPFMIDELEPAIANGLADPFVSESSKWGLGGCIELLPTLSKSTTTLRGALKASERHILDLALTIEALLEGMNCLVYRERPLSNPEDLKQFATVQTIIQSKSYHQNCSIGSSLSKDARRTVRMVISGPEDARIALFQKIALAMKDAYQILHPRDLCIQEDALLRISPAGTTYGLLNVTVLSPKRIQLECIGASLSIDPVYEKTGDGQGAQWEPHNVDSLDCQLTLLAGLSTLYQELHPF